MNDSIETAYHIWHGIVGVVFCITYIFTCVALFLTLVGAPCGALMFLHIYEAAAGVERISDGIFRTVLHLFYDKKEITSSLDELDKRLLNYCA